MEEYKNNYSNNYVSKNYYKEKLLDDNNRMKAGHRCLLIERSKMELTGVINVISFDANEIILTTKLGDLLIKGNELHISKLNLEQSNVDIEGKIDALIYSNKSLSDKNAKGIMARLFR